ncbi:hypothetical protein [Arthrobacter sp. A5]
MTHNSSPNRILSANHCYPAAQNPGTSEPAAVDGEHGTGDE